MTDSNSARPTSGGNQIARGSRNESDDLTPALSEVAGRQVVVVLGMHRSGTSLLSNILHVLGVDMADTTDSVSPKNAGGFWERPELVALHDEVLAALGRPLSLPSHSLAFPPGWWRLKEVQAVKPKLAAYVREQLRKSPHLWGFKDPRSCRLLPLWREIFRDLQISPVYVHAIRAPAEAAVSMSQKSSARQLSPELGELMWLSYNRDIVHYVTSNEPTVVVDYQEWFSEPAGVVQRLVGSLGVGADLDSDEMRESVSAVIQADYRHHVAGGGGVASKFPITETFYEAIKANGGSVAADPQRLHGQLEQIDDLLKSFAPLAGDLDASVRARSNLEGELRELAERQAAAEQLVAQKEARIAKLERERDTSIAKLQSARKAVEEGQNRPALSELELARHRLKGKLHREQQRSRALLRSAKSWRERAWTTQRELEVNDREAADRIEALSREYREGRLLAAERAAELQRSLRAVKRALAAAEERNERFTAELERQKRELLSHGVNADRLAGAGEQASGCFVWPTGSGPELVVEGGIDVVDDSGILGRVRIVDRPDLIPVVEARIEGELVLAQSCTAGELDHRISGSDEWQYRIPWSVFAPERAGREAVICVAGLAHELGTARLPDDLHLYHLPPAELAAQLLGETPAEAAEYHRWIEENESAEATELARFLRHEGRADWPNVTVIVHGKHEEAATVRTLRSLVAQVHAGWEAICLDTPKDLAKIDPRVRVVSGDDLARELSAYAEDALFTFIEAGDTVAETALMHLAIAALGAGEFALIYSDEDRIEPRFGVRAVPYMKGAWSPDLALVQDYVSRLALVRRKSLPAAGPLSVRGIVLRAALCGPGPVIHLPFVLYHRAAGNVQSDASSANVVEQVLAEAPPEFRGATLVQTEDCRSRLDWPLPDPLPRISLVVPTRDRLDLLRVCIDGFLNETRYPDIEILIADNDSEREETRAYLAAISADPRVRVISCPGPFNFSAINNRAVAESSGELIGLMNNDLKVIEPDWLHAMVAQAIRPEIGIVGAKLLHGDETIQHAGVTLGIGIASHLYKSFPGIAEGRNGRLIYAQDVSAVTAACLLMRRDVWEEVGGLDEEFPVAYNDVDLCLKVRSAGYRILWTPQATLYHLESQSRGRDISPEKRERLDLDKARLTDRWGELLSSDPFHSPNLSDRHVDARLAFPSRARAPWRTAAK